MQHVILSLVCSFVAAGCLSAREGGTAAHEGTVTATDATAADTGTSVDGVDATPATECMLDDALTPIEAMDDGVIGARMKVLFLFSTADVVAGSVRFDHEVQPGDPEYLVWGPAFGTNGRVEGLVVEGYCRTFQPHTFSTRSWDAVLSVEGEVLARFVMHASFEIEDWPAVTFAEVTTEGPLHFILDPAAFAAERTRLELHGAEVALDLTLTWVDEGPEIEHVRMVSRGDTLSGPLGPLLDQTSSVQLDGQLTLTAR